jgi:hypothetical protein
MTELKADVTVAAAPIRDAALRKRPDTPEGSGETSEAKGALAQVMESPRDAGVVEGPRDAGPDGSAPEPVPTRRGPAAKNETPPAPEPSLSERVADRPGEGARPPKAEGFGEHLEALFRAVFTPNCASLEVAKAKDGDAAVVTVDWKKARCGDFSKNVSLRRDGKNLTLPWQGVESQKPGQVRFTARDQVGKGPHQYTLRFPSNPTANRLAPVLMVKDYLSFAVRILLAFGLIFELPILISFLAIAGIVDYRQLIRFARYFFVVAVIIGAMLTPPDVVTQLLLAAPLMVLYGLSVVVAYIFGERPSE